MARRPLRRYTTREEVLARIYRYTSERSLLASVVIVTSTDTGTDKSLSLILSVDRHLEQVH